jgi:hypothetical protein
MNIPSHSLFLLLLALASTFAFGQVEIHEWTNKAGRTIKAKFVRGDAESVVIFAGGRNYNLKLADLSEESQDLARKLSVSPPASLTKPFTPNKPDPSTNSEKPSAPAGGKPLPLATPEKDQIIKFCRENMGKQVGNGQCTELAKHAFRVAGAQSRQKNPDFPDKGDYVWGESIACLETTGRGLKETGNLKDIQPGDVIQFRDVQMNGKKPIGRGHYTKSFTHHTAVVSEVENRGRIVKVYHQNTGGRKFVVEHSLNLDDLKAGWMRFYRAR